MYAAAAGLDFQLLESRRLDQWVRQIRSRIREIAAILIALATLLGAANLLLERAKSTCATLNICSSKNSRALLLWPAAHAEAAPQLLSYTSGWVGGGATAERFCIPQQEAYARQYPRYSISTEMQSAVRKDIFGHVDYNFTCVFHASPKAVEG